MSSGSKSNDNAASGATDKAVAAAQPKNYSDPFGTLKNGTFTPTLNDSQKNLLTSSDAYTNTLFNQLPTSFDVNDFYNNPFYDTTKDLYAAPVQRQYQQDNTDLDNNLNARNQIGSSYDALSHSKLQQNRDFQLNQADDQARTASASAYQQAISNLLAGVQQGQNTKGTLLDQIYSPAKIATNYQQAISPLQTAQTNAYTNLANYYGQRPTGYQNVLSGVNAFGSLLGGAGSAASGAAALAAL